VPAPTANSIARRAARRLALLGGLLPLLVAVPIATAGADHRAAQTQVEGGLAMGRLKSAKIDTGLLAVSRTTAPASGIETVNGRLRVIVRTTPGAAGSVVDRVGRLGGFVEIANRGVIQALLPPKSVGPLASSVGVRQIARAYEEIPAAIGGEEVASTGAASWHAAGVTGAGVKVAIIDPGFRGLNERIAAGDLPANAIKGDFCQGQFDGSEHGAAVAEIVYEMAPGAQLYLLCARTQPEVIQAEAYAKAQGVAIINYSAGDFLTGRGDGVAYSGTTSAAAVDARNSGILWVNSAGNSAHEHWHGTFADSDGDRWSELPGGSEANLFEAAPREEFCAFLKWDQWPSSNQDFDLAIVDGSARVVATSEYQQTGTQFPIEATCYTNPSSSVQTFGIAIWKAAATKTPRMDVFVHGDYEKSLKHQRADGSIAMPAVSPSVFTVGASCYASGALEPYSSQGPTIDGRTKPDISGPAGMSSGTYGRADACNRSGFSGTSASAPAVAGAAALVKQAFPTYGPAQIQSYLESRAVEAGTAGRDNAFGAGRLNLGAGPAGAPVATLPSVGDPSVQSVDATSATVTATVNPSGSAAQYRVEYGASATSWTDLAAGTAAVPVSVRLTGLSPQTEYRFAFAVKNASGTVRSAEQSFTTSATARDSEAPVVRAQASSGTAGRVVALFYSVGDNTNRVRVVDEVVRAGKTVGRVKTSFLAVDGGARSVVWRAPKALRGKRLKHCIRAWDQAGNASPRSCARLTLR
jgi:hypothetical protein